ncbi:MAG: hypothetical protein HYV07_27350 [Deltaproteobacteria bacterium]|nr:hypothetical protein [Deltaproteobacteria bacterium]
MLTSNAEREAKTDEVNGIRAIVSGATLGSLEDTARLNRAKQQKRSTETEHVPAELYLSTSTELTAEKQREIDARKGRLTNPVRAGGVDHAAIAMTLAHRTLVAKNSVIRTEDTGEEKESHIPRKPNKLADPLQPVDGRSAGRGPRRPETPVPESLDARQVIALFTAPRG